MATNTKQSELYLQEIYILCCQWICAEGFFFQQFFFSFAAVIKFCTSPKIILLLTLIVTCLHRTNSSIMPFRCSQNEIPRIPGKLKPQHWKLKMCTEILEAFHGLERWRDIKELLSMFLWNVFKGSKISLLWILNGHSGQRQFCLQWFICPSHKAVWARYSCWQTLLVQVLCCNPTWLFRALEKTDIWNLLECSNHQVISCSRLAEKERLTRALKWKQKMPPGTNFGVAWSI